MPSRRNLNSVCITVCWLYGCTSLDGPTNRLVAVESGIFTSLACAHDIMVYPFCTSRSSSSSHIHLHSLTGATSFPSFRCHLYLHDSDLGIPPTLPFLRRKLNARQKRVKGITPAAPRSRISLFVKGKKSQPHPDHLIPATIAATARWWRTVAAIDRPGTVFSCSPVAGGGVG